MSETAPPGASRVRGVGFPTVPLADAAAAVRRIARHGPHHSEAAFAQYLGHNTTNSGAYRQKAAAYRDWGLITSSAGRIALTDLSRRLAMAEEPDDREVLQEVFFGCDVFRAVYDECAKGQPIETEWLARRAVLMLGVAAASAQRFVESFVSSAVTAGVAKRLSDRSFALDAPPELDADANQPAAPPRAAVPAHTYYGGDPVPTAALTTRPPVALRQEWPLADGVVVFEIRSARPLPAAAFVAIAGAVTAAASVAEALAGDTSDE